MLRKIVVDVFLACLFIVVCSPAQHGFCDQAAQIIHKNKKITNPKAYKGVINLADWDFEKNGSVKLNGEWEFYWNKLYSPKDFLTDRSAEMSGFFNVPGSWNYYLAGDESFPGHGYATYRLKLKLKKEKAYALKILPISTACQVWVDGEFISVGKVGRTKEEMTPQFAVKTIRFVPAESGTEIVLQVSNYYHRAGGPWRTIELGLFEQMYEQKIKLFAFDLFLIGAILIIGIYYFALFILRRKDVATLYFSGLCLAAVVRTLVTGEHSLYFLFPGLNWLIAYKFVYLSFFLGTTLAVLFINNIYPDESLPGTSKISATLAIIFSLIVCFTQPQIFSHTMKTYQVITVISMLYMTYVMFKAVLNKKEGALLVVVGSTLGFAAVINDILYAKEIIHSFYMAPAGLFVFMLFHSFNLSMKFSSAFLNIEIIEKKYRSIFENSLDGISQIYIVDETAIVNPALADILGYSFPDEVDLLANQTLKQVFVDNLLCEQYLLELRVKKRVSDFEAELYRKDGSIIWVSINSTARLDQNNQIVTIDSIIHDITLRKEKEMLEEKMIQVQKMEAAGHLAGGIAHDFKNIISAISSNIQVLKMDKDDVFEKREKKFQNITRACDRAISLIKQIMTFSNMNRRDNFKPIQLESTIKEVTQFIRNTIPESVKIELDIHQHSFKVLSDSTQIYQVLMNLFYNAISAMEKTGGVIRVGLEPAKIEGIKISTGFLPRGDYVQLSVSDTGEGISSDIIDNIFDPYYTTKEQGKGTGLGLAIVHRIVKSHGGEVSVKSKKGEGTIFKLYFPVTDRTEPEKESDQNHIKITGQGKLLFVEDEEVIAETFDELLGVLGFDIDTCLTPKKALGRINKGSHDVIITDLHMPQMNGVEFVREVRKKDPAVKIIICSGDISLISPDEYSNLELFAIIQKPLDYDELAKLIWQAIDSE